MNIFRRIFSRKRQEIVEPSKKEIDYSKPYELQLLDQYPVTLGYYKNIVDLCEDRKWPRSTVYTAFKEGREFYNGYRVVKHVKNTSTS